MQPVIVFDLVGTLLDLAGLDDRFLAAFGSAKVRREWFDEVLKIALTSCAVNVYTEFTDVARAGLTVLEQRRQMSLSDADRLQLLKQMEELPAFSDVEPSLERLRDQGLRLAVLTNSSERAARSALKHNGIDRYFAGVFSTDSVQRFKPAHEPYEMAAQALGVGVTSLLLVAAHNWDISGASWAGCKTCFVARPQQFLDDATPRPNFYVNDLAELASQLAADKAA